ncbi:MAG: hypothetical protein MUP27_10475, partial [Desulfobacterales bacterium]|nr:hypothetical protein [Desulfobacterales bacterium]
GVEPPLGWNLAQREKTGFRIKSGMTKCVKLFMKYYTSKYPESLIRLHIFYGVIPTKVGIQKGNTGFLLPQE